MGHSVVLSDKFHLSALTGFCRKCCNLFARIENCLSECTNCAIMTAKFYSGIVDELLSGTSKIVHWYVLGKQKRSQWVSTHTFFLVYLNLTLTVIHCLSFCPLFEKPH